MQAKEPPPTCPLCGCPLASEPTTTITDVAPYLTRREPPVSVRVHRSCAARAVSQAQPAEVLA